VIVCKGAQGGAVPSLLTIEMVPGVSRSFALFPPADISAPPCPKLEVLHLGKALDSQVQHTLVEQASLWEVLQPEPGEDGRQP
jgi:hypothetical protein